MVKAIGWVIMTSPVWGSLVWLWTIASAAGL